MSCQIRDHEFESHYSHHPTIKGVKNEKRIKFLKEHKIEAFVATFVVTFLFVSYIFLVTTIYNCVHTIDEAGGLRTIVVESGKEIKSIINDINKK